MSSPGHDIPDAIVSEHVTRLRTRMEADDLAAVLLFHSSNMLAFAGTPHTSTDRITCGAVTREGQTLVVCPAFERPALDGSRVITSIHTWEEHEDPYRCFVDALAQAGVRSGIIGVDGRIWLRALAAFERALEGFTIRSAEMLLREVRMCKSATEQDVLRAAHCRGEKVFVALRDELLRPGVRECDLRDTLFERFEPDGIAVQPLIQSGPNGSIPHNPTGRRVIEDGDVVVVDSVIRWRGYHSDITRTFAIGRPSARAQEAYGVVRAAQAAAIEAARPGVPCCQLDEIARRVISDAGFGEFFTHRLGHGMGLEGHEPPYLSGQETETLRPGMCCTVEPGIYVPGEFGIRIEDPILITTDGCEVISGGLPTDVTDAFET